MNEVITIGNVKDIEKLNGTNLVRLFNELNPKKPVRKFADRATGLKRTIAAYEAAGSRVVEFEGSGSSSKESKPEAKAKPAPKAKDAPKPKGKRARKVFDLKPKGEIKAHRDGTARAAAVAALTGKGATFEEVQKATGWASHRHAYEGIRLLNTHLGYGIREKDGVISLYTA